MQAQIQEVANLLQRRGFIFEQKSEDVFKLISHHGFSNTYYQDDCRYLADILTAAHAGEENCGYFRLAGDADLTYLKALFQTTDERVGVGAGGQKQAWSSVQSDCCGYEFPVRWLDPNVAYYARVMGLCGLKTSGCCDGNHFKRSRQKLYVTFDPPVYSAFHKWMWENLPVPCRIPWVWGTDGAAVRLSPEKRAEVYENLMLAARFFLDMNEQLIAIRQEAARRIDAEKADSMDEAELTSMFIKEVNNVFQHK